MAVPKPAENKPAARLIGPIVLLTAQFNRCGPVIGWYEVEVFPKAFAGGSEGLWAAALAVTRSTTAKTCPGLIFIEGLVANDWARFAWEENAEELSLKRAGKAAFSHRGTGGFGLGGWGEPTSYPCGGPYQAVPGGVFHDITAQADRSGSIRGNPA